MSSAGKSDAKDDDTSDKKFTILVVDDEPSICWALEKTLSGQGYHVLTASSAEAGIQIVQRSPVDLVFLDVRLPQEDGLSALPRFRELTGNCPVIVMTAFGDLETAVSAVKQGASDYMVKPFGIDDALRVCNDQLANATSAVNPKQIKRNPVQEGKLIGSSPAMQQAFRQIALVAVSDLSVLITGETGTGKELVAAAIHRHSDRSDKPYLPIAPVAFNKDLIESELFGHVKGAFTGADSDKPGLFERAEGGTVLLDEIGDLPIALQVKLLRVLEQGEYFRVGDMRPRRCDVRILAATNQNLLQAMQEGRFREDLYYRLSGLHIHLPPLRERKQDIPILCQYFLSQLCDGKDASQLSDNLLSELCNRPWHGNVRELRNAVDHAAVVARGRRLTIQDFPDPLAGSPAKGDEEQTELEQAIQTWMQRQLQQSDPRDLHGAFVSASEPVLFDLALQFTNDNRAAAAEILGIHRGTLREKLKQYRP